MFWNPLEDTDITIRFKMLDCDSLAPYGAFEVGFGGLRHWRIGIHPHGIVYSPFLAPILFPFPPEIGANGYITDGNSYTLQIGIRGDDDTMATVRILDSDGDAADFTVTSSLGADPRIWWGDGGPEAQGHVQIEDVSWTTTDQNTLVTDVLYSTTPSDVVSGNQVNDFSGDQIGASYNPTWWKPWTYFWKESDLDSVIARLTNRVIIDMRNSGWKPRSNDPGSFGKEVHARVAARMTGEKGRWMSNVWVRESDNLIVYIGNRPPGALNGLVQIDEIALLNRYQPRVGEILDPTRIKLYDIKSSIDGKMKAAQRARLSAVMHGGEFSLVHGEYYCDTSGAWQRVLRADRVMLILELAGLAASAYNLVHSDAYEDEWDRIVITMDEAKRQTDPALRSLALADAGSQIADYLEHFAPDNVSVRIPAAAKIEDILSCW